MRIVYVNAYDEAGQRFNGYLLHQALRGRGHDSTFVVADRTMNDPSVVGLGVRLLHNLNWRLARLERRLGLQSVLPVLNLQMLAQAYYRRADIIHLQLLHPRPFFGLWTLPLMTLGRRVVWTVHDPWLLAGHCVHSLGCERWLTGCGQCPDLSIPLAVGRDATALNWRVKRWALALSKVHLVVASPWMERRVRRSPILRHHPCTVIPFGLDLDCFKPLDKAQCRQRLGIPPEARVLALRWQPQNIVKGSEYALRALELLPPGAVTHVLRFEGKSDTDMPSIRGRYQIIDLGWIDSGAAMAQALNAADVFVMPSIAETFGMMAVESLACGTPVVVFEGTALPEVVRAPQAGIAVEYRNAQALAAAIGRVLDDAGLRRGLVDRGLELVAREYAQATYIRRHLELYESLARPRRGQSRRTGE
jgi:glycosyltransferase involved in cell wall biosynthesis